MATYRISQEVDMGPSNAISRQSMRTRRARVVLGLVTVATLTGTTQVLAADPGSGRTSGGPWINRTLSGGVVRDLSIQELTAINRGVGIQFPLR